MTVDIARRRQFLALSALALTPAVAQTATKGDRNRSLSTAYREGWDRIFKGTKMSEHNEPWKIEQEFSDYSYEKVDIITDCNGDNPIQPLVDDDGAAELDTAPATLPRIVACVNAMAGIEAPEAFINTTVKYMADEINTLRKLLRDLLDTSFWYGGSDVSDTPEWKAADEQLSRDAQ